MKSSKQIREAMAELDDRIQAITALSIEESRELSDEETQEIDRIQGSVDDDSDHGEMGKLQSELKRVEKIEQRQQVLAAERGAQQIAVVGSDGDSATGRIIVPASAKRHGKLVAFTSGSTLEENRTNAYVAGRCFAASLFGHKASKQWLEENGVQAGLYESDDTNGGVFVPVETETEIIRLVESFGLFRQDAKIAAMGSDTKIVPVRTGGMTAYAVGETNDNNRGSNTATLSSPSYTRVELVARKWKAECRISDELNEDALIEMAEQVVLELAQAFAYAEDNSGFNGDGGSAYHGIVGLANALNAGAIYTAPSGSLAFADLTLTDFETAIGKLADFPGMMPCVYISKPGYFASIANLLNAAGGNTKGDIESGMGLQFMGLPVKWSQVLPKALTDQASTVLAYVGDLGMSTVMGNRRGLTISTTDQRYWDEDEIGIKGTSRMDIKVHSTGDATTAGAMVAIKTPAS